MLLPIPPPMHLPIYTNAPTHTHQCNLLAIIPANPGQQSNFINPNLLKKGPMEKGSLKKGIGHGRLGL